MHPSPPKAPINDSIPPSAPTLVSLTVFEKKKKFLHFNIKRCAHVVHMFEYFFFMYDIWARVLVGVCFTSGCLCRLLLLPLVSTEKETW